MPAWGDERPASALDDVMLTHKPCRERTRGRVGERPRRRRARAKDGRMRPGVGVPHHGRATARLPGHLHPGRAGPWRSGLAVGLLGPMWMAAERAPSRSLGAVSLRSWCLSGWRVGGWRVAKPRQVVMVTREVIPLAPWSTVDSTDVPHHRSAKRPPPGRDRVEGSSLPRWADHTM